MACSDVKGLKYLTFLFAFIFLLSSVSAIVLPYQLSEDPNGYTIQYSQVGITQVATPVTLYFHVVNSSNGIAITNASAACSFYFYGPDGMPLISNAAMPYDTSNSAWYQNINSTTLNTTGINSYVVSCLSKSNDQGGYVRAPIQVTVNGNEPPSGIVIVAFSIFFLALMGLVVYSIISLLYHTVTIDYDIVDVAYSTGSYFAIITLQALEKEYLGNGLFGVILSTARDIGLWTQVVIPLFIFAVCLMLYAFDIKPSWLKKNDKEN